MSVYLRSTRASRGRDCKEMKAFEREEKGESKAYASLAEGARAYIRHVDHTRSFACLSSMTLARRVSACSAWS